MTSNDLATVHVRHNFHGIVERIGQAELSRPFPWEGSGLWTIPGRRGGGGKGLACKATSSQCWYTHPHKDQRASGQEKKAKSTFSVPTKLSHILLAVMANPIAATHNHKKNLNYPKQLTSHSVLNLK